MAKLVVLYKKLKMPRPSTSIMLRFTSAHKGILPTLQMAAPSFTFSRRKRFENGLTDTRTFERPADKDFD
jgi:hypothetical protein